LIKFDFYYLVGFVIQYDLVDVHFKEPEYSLTMALIPAALLLMVLGAYFVRREYRVATIFIAVSPRAPSTAKSAESDLTKTDLSPRRCGLFTESDNNFGGGFATCYHTGKGVDVPFRRCGTDSLYPYYSMYDLLYIEF
jgi:hypothetical protein